MIPYYGGANMTEEHKAYLSRALSEETWTATCRVCGKFIEGTPEQLAGHKHPSSEDDE